MKKKYLLPVFGLFALGIYSFQSLNNQQKISIFHKSGSGANFNATGAPGESNCSACHGSGTQSGATENVFTILNGSTPVTDYLPGTTYNVTLSMASNPVKKGFSILALNSSNTNAGSFTASSPGGTTKHTNGTKQYITHNSTSNTSSTATWSWTWTAPATNVGTVTFYLATNKANNNNNDDAGDIIYLSQHTISSTAGINENNESQFKVYFNANENKLNINFNALQANAMTLNLLDASGKSVFYADLGNSTVGEVKESIELPSLKNGVYFVHLFNGNKAYNGQISIVK
jgi:hypothetical protein